LLGNIRLRKGTRVAFGYNYTSGIIYYKMLVALISYSGSSITLTLKRFAQQYTSGFQLLATVYNYITDCQDFLVNDTDH